MAEDIINFDLPVNRSSIIKVIGVGGGGSNAVNHMYKQGIKDVDFIVCNTDAQALNSSPVDVKIQLGATLTEGRGSGNKPDIGKQAAIESLNEIVEVLSSNTKMIFITAGMGGGTGTGAAPVIAKATKELGVLTVAIVTIPFRFEGQQRINQAIEGINELKEYVDALLVINNEKLREIHGDLKLSKAFARADDVLATAAKGIAEIITLEGYINVDFEDVKTVMENSGVAIMGSGSANGDNRAINAIEEAINSPLLNDNEITGAKNILLNITSGSDELSMDEVGEITDYINNEVDSGALIIWGTGIDEKLENKVNVTIIATGFEASSIPDLYIKKRTKERITLNDSVKTGNDKEDFKESGIQSNVSDDKDINITQRTIEFDLTGENYQTDMFSSDKESGFLDFKVDKKKAAERVKELKKANSIIREKEEKANEDKSIEELENEPAYVRKNVKIDNKKH